MELELLKKVKEPAPFSESKDKKALFDTCIMPVSALTFSSTLKFEAIYCS